MRGPLLVLAVLFPLSLAFAKIELIPTNSKNVLKIKLTSGQLRTQLNRHGGKNTTKVSIHDFVTPPIAGAPSLPVESRLIAIPEGKLPVLKTSVPRSVRVQLPHAVSPVQKKSHCGGTHSTTRSTIAYRKAQSEPLIELSEVSYAGPVRAALLTWRPVRLTEKENVVVLTDEMEVGVQFVDSNQKASGPPVNPVGLHESMQEIYGGLTLNSNPVTHYRAGEQSQERELMIVHESYKNEEALMKILRVKSEQGRLVKVHYLSGASKKEVKKLIQEEYKKSPAPVHTTLIGSIDQIPSYRRWFYWSDFPYTLLDSGDLPDLSIARYPVENAEELKAIHEKVVARRNTPRDDEKVLVTSGYETNWCHRNLKYIQENIFDHSELPLDITKLYATEGKHTHEVIAGYNDNPNIIIYDGHGREEGMTEIPFLIEHLDDLTNTVNPIIFDIACLNSYWPSSGADIDNFAQSMIVLKTHGAAGILASSHNSNGHDFFRHMFRAFIHDEKNEKEPFHHINEMGAIVLYGKLKYLEEYGPYGSALDDSYMFYYHGDPASRIFSKK